MTSRSDRIVQVFEAAVILEPAERLAFVRSTCGDDPELCQQVEAMLADAERSLVIDRPVGEAVGQIFDDEPMVAAGTRFGPYQVESLLGAGGMGEVYRATDTVLGRQVAIKILPADVSRDAERTARFRREAKILASLNHSNIGAIYGVESAASSPEAPLGLVLELIEGPTLADRLRSGALPLDEALGAARQIAEALDAAHQQGVVHRDLKPGNIKLRDDGVVKVLDFGLARVDQAQAESSGGRPLADSPTITTPAMTAAGVLLGTAAYMSPEQAKGRPADKRSDIWAFGCVLYEMLTGTRAFGGDDVADTLAAVLRGEPDYTQLPRDTPEPVRALLRGCLTKDRHRRIADVSAVRFVLDNIAHFTSPAGLSASPPIVGRAWRRALWPMAAALVLAASTGAAVWSLTRPEPPPLTRYAIAPTGSAAVHIDGIARDLTVLPDGAVVYKAFGSQSAMQLWLRARDQSEPRVLVATGNPRGPFSSPDGQRIGYIDIAAGGPELKTIAVSGGAAIKLCELGTYPSSGATWGDDEQIVFATLDPSTGLHRVGERGGKAVVLTKPDAKRGEGDHVWPQYLPGGRAVLFTITPPPGSDRQPQIAVFDLRAGSYKVLDVPGGSQAQYTQSGHLVYLAGGGLSAVPFDLERLAVTGAPSPIPIEVHTLSSSGAAEFDISRNGTLAYVRAGASTRANRTFVWVDRDVGRESPIKEIPSGEYMHPRLSPDESHLAFSLGERQTDVYVWNFDRGTRARVTTEGGNQTIPLWLDNRHIAYASILGGPSVTGRVFRRAIDGTGNAEPLHPADRPLAPSSMYGETLLAWTFLATSDVFAVNLRKRTIEPWYQTPYIERNADISPDGQWVAYEASDPAKSLEFQVYIRPRINPNAAEIQVSTQGGWQPRWNPRDGTELFYLGLDGALYAVRIEPGPVPAPRAPRRIVEGSYYRGVFSGIYAARMYDVSNDGRRFLMIKDGQTAATATASIEVTHNWLEDLKRLVGSK
jgi:serine/threonine protein kinase